MSKKRQNRKHGSQTARENGIQNASLPLKRQHEEETDSLEPKEKRLNTGHDIKSSTENGEEKLHTEREEEEINPRNEEEKLHTESEEEKINSHNEEKLAADLKNEVNQSAVVDAEQNKDDTKEQNSAQEDKANLTAPVKSTAPVKHSLVDQRKVFQGPTKEVALDCEMVGAGERGELSILARATLVNRHGAVLLDKFVRPTEKVTDYRTSVSGIRPEDLKNADRFRTVKKRIEMLIKGKILVGHSVHNDLNVLGLTHPPFLIRDTSRYKPFRAIVDGRTPSLKRLAQHVLGITIQQGEHSSVIDAQATMKIYDAHSEDWEKNYMNKPRAIRFLEEHGKTGKQQGKMKIHVMAKKKKVKKRVKRVGNMIKKKGKGKKRKRGR